MDNNKTIPSDKDIQKIILFLMDYSLATGFKSDHMDPQVITEYIKARWDEI